MKKLKEQWTILKDEKAPKVDRRDSAKEIINLQEELVKIKKDFEPIDLTMTKYSEFVPMDYKHDSKVKWGNSYTESPELTRAIDVVENCEAVAVMITRELIPTEPVDSQKFGMIVSAKCEKLIKAYYEERKLNIRDKSGK